MVQWLNRSHTYQHPWERVTYAFWRKYPNPMSPHVVDVDVLDRHVDDEGRLHSTRLITCKDKIPDWISAAVGGKNHCYVLEKSCVDAKNKTLIMKSRNLSYDSLLNVDETCTYSVDPTNTTHTMFTQHAKITVPVFGFGGKVETICSSNFHTNAKKGLQVMETICDKIKAETTEFFTGGAPKVEGTTL